MRLLVNCETIVICLTTVLFASVCSQPKYGNLFFTDYVNGFNISNIRSVPHIYGDQVTHATQSAVYSVDHGNPNSAASILVHSSSDENERHTSDEYVRDAGYSMGPPDFNQHAFSSVFSDYLGSGQFQNYIRQCHNYYREPFDAIHLTKRNFKRALEYAIPKIIRYMRADDEIYRTVEATKDVSLLVRKIAHEAKFMEYITEYFVIFHCANKFQTSLEIPMIKVRKYLPPKVLNEFGTTNCGVLAVKPICNPHAMYASLDGSCNNLKYPSQGKSYTCHRRLLPPDYADGVYKIRESILGGPLPNARVISNEVLLDVKKLDYTVTQMNMQWGQFIIHDQTRTSLILGNTPQCCPPAKNQHPECERIYPFPPGDSLTKRFNQTCQRGVRSIICATCNAGPRNQMNAAPMSYDLSNVYGYTYKDSLQFRTFKGGKLSTGVDILGNPILVGAEGNFDPLTIQNCNQPPQYPEFHCFNSGDGNRVNQHPALTALQILVTRRHNQHAEVLSKVNPHWDDEKLYLEARRILIAESQHITYSQYIPSLLSDDLLHYFNLLPLKKGYTKYEPHTDVSTIQEFVTSTGRFGHSQINNVFHVKNDPPMDSFTYYMRDAFFDMTLIYLGQTDGIIRGLISELAFAVDPYFVTDVKDFMYQHRNRTSGLDLMGLNIMRGRDHGIPGYVHYLDYCFGYKVNGWGDLHKYIPGKQLNLLESVYKHWQDIDLFVGGVCETRVPGNAFGPVFACINGIQWYHSKYGDRFYYEHGGEAGSFSPHQLESIRRTSSLSHLICKTTGIQYVTRNVFKPESEKNPVVHCSEFGDLDYELWKQF